MTKYCDICQGSRKVRMPTYATMPASIAEAKASVPQVNPFKEFDCPQCVPRVPFRRVRACRVVGEYQPEDFARMQNIIQRKLAAQFGEFLMKEGLIKFTTDSLEDFTKPTISVTASIGVVSNDDTDAAKIEPEYAYVPATISQPVDEKLARKLKREREERIRRKRAGDGEPYMGRRGVVVTDGDDPVDSTAKALNELMERERSRENEMTRAFPAGTFGRKKTRAEIAAEAAQARDNLDGRFSGIDLGEDEY